MNTRIISFSICSDFFMLFLFAMANLLCLFNMTAGIYIAKILLLGFILFFIMKSMKINGTLSLYTLFLGFCLFFIYSRIYFDLIGFWHRQVNDFYFFFTKIHFSDELVMKFFNFSILFFVFFDFGYYLNPKKYIKIIPVSDNEFAKRIVFFLMLITTPLLLYKSILDIRYVRTYGYSSVLDRMNYPFYLKGAGTLFIASFYASFMFKLSKKEFIFIIILYLLQSMGASLRGSRSVFMIPFIMSLYMISKFDIAKIKFRTLVLIGCISVFIISMMTIFLRGESFIGNTLLELIYYILYGQGNSIGVPLYYLHHQNSINDVQLMPFIFQDLVHLYNNNILAGSGYIAAIVNTKKVEGGLGESLFLELLDMPLFFSLPFSLFIGWFINFIEANMLRNRFFLPMALIISSWVIVWARFAFFHFLEIHNIVSYILAILFFIFAITFSKYGVKSSKGIVNV